MQAMSTDRGMGRFFRFANIEIPEVWIRFLLAIVGLVLAFAAALFSTVFRESGNLWATLILASAALLLAVIVGLTTVPYLMRRVTAARLRNAFEYEVTAVGIGYVLCALVLGIAALNTGNNLLYIIVAAMLAGLLVSGIASAVELRDLELDVRVPDNVFANRTTKARILLRNPSRLLPAFSVHVAAPKGEKSAQKWRWAQSSFGFPPGRSPGKQWFRLPDRKLSRGENAASLPPIFERSVYFPYISPRSELRADIDLRFHARGRYQQKNFALSTRFPFALLRKIRRVPLLREIIVYPPVDPADDFFEILPLITGEFESFVRGRGYDLYRIREYMPDDSARHVDWKATARSGSPKVKEFTREDERKLRIVFDNPTSGSVSVPAYEKAVSLAASLGWHFAGENAELSFLAPGYDGDPDIYRFLHYLALLQPQAGTSVIEKLRPSAEYNIIFTSQPRGSVPTALWACSYFVFIGEQAKPGAPRSSHPIQEPEARNT
jgi:uncharacterized protein (DUF58 family)